MLAAGGNLRQMIESCLNCQQQFASGLLATNLGDSRVSDALEASAVILAIAVIQSSQGIRNKAFDFVENGFSETCTSVDHVVQVELRLLILELGNGRIIIGVAGGRDGGKQAAE